MQYCIDFVGNQLLMVYWYW